MSETPKDKLTHQKDKPTYSVEEILSEFSTTRENQRVVPFPTRPHSEDEEEIPTPHPDGKTAEIIDLPPDNLLFELETKVRGLFRRADEYAEQMYQHSEPSKEEREAEQYIPGVDVEETSVEEEPEEPDPPKHPRRPRRKPPELPRDDSPAELALKFKHGLSATRLRLFPCLLLALAATYLALELPLPSFQQLSPYYVRLLGSVAILTCSCALCADVLAAGLIQLFTFHPNIESLCSLAAMITLADGLTMPTLGTRSDSLPYTAPVCFMLLFSLWGRYLKRKSDYLSCRTASQAKEPYLLTLDDAKWSGRPAYAKFSSPLHGFGSQLQCPDGAQKAWSIAAPLLLLTCIACSLLATVGREKPNQLLWALSATLTASATCSSLLVYALPYHRITRRLTKYGSALAGWPGAANCTANPIILSDGDLFPTGTIKLNGIKIYGDFSTEKVVSYTATLIQAAHNGLEKPFSDLMKSQNGRYRPVTGVRFHEGGITAIIRNQEIIVGTSAFFHLMNIALPQGLRVKNAIFCAINGELAGIFAILYSMQPDVSPCCNALMRNKLPPLLATRDPNLLPSLLGQKFKLPVDRMEFPAVDRRLELSNPEQSHNDILTAVLLREGLLPYSDAAIGAHRLRSAVRVGNLLSILGAVMGVVLTFYLTFVDAYHSLSPSALLVFLLAWLIPILFLGDWSERY